MFIAFLLVLAGAFFLLRRGTLFGAGGPPPWLAAHRAAHLAPEADAKKILADRFAQGEISAEEFMERASVLNWTPGLAEPAPERKRKPRR